LNKQAGLYKAEKDGIFLKNKLASNEHLQSRGENCLFLIPIFVALKEISKM